MTIQSVPGGEDLIAIIGLLTAGPGAWLSGVGAVEDAELLVAMGEEDVARIAPGRSTLVALSGPVGGPWMAILARADGAGVGIVAGRLVKARSAGMTLSIASGESAAVQAAPAPAAARTGATPRHPAPPKEADDESEEGPRFGDFVDHFVFGLCEVMVIRGDRMKIRDVKPPGKLREIHTGAVKVLHPVERDGRRVFPLVRRT